MTTVEELMDSVLENLTKTCEEIPNFQGIVYDSRVAKKDDLFVAIPGYQSDGHQFLQHAKKNGAVGAVVETLATNIGIPQWQVSDTRRALSRLARNFYQKPFLNKPIIGITGTNGKTTVVHCVAKILNNAGISTGRIGTLGLRYDSRNNEHTKLTTPESLDLQRMLRYLEDASMACCVMEVSSHALSLNRVADVDYSVAVFTNFTQDHLDFHGDMETYFEAKSLLFRNLEKKATAIINLDSQLANRLIEKTNARICTYSMINSDADFAGYDLQITASGIRGKIKTPNGTLEIMSPMVGRFNAENLLASVATASAMNVTHKIISETICDFYGAPGRMERIETDKANIFVDYAHTPDGFQNVLSTVKDIRDQSERNGKIIVIFGCGGDRDQGKRPKMGKIAEKFSDIVILTDDNQRFENPEKIIEHILNGIKKQDKIQIIRNREDAIRHALSLASPNDFVLVLGKGHENYHDVLGEKQPYSDLNVIQEAIN